MSISHELIRTVGAGFKRRLPFILKALGVCLIGSAVFAGYLFYYRYVPMLHLANPKWCAAHSAKAHWEEEQKKYRRNPTASPDLCFLGDKIGYYGDKQWCLWLIEKMYGKKGFRVCGCTETALMYMTNHEPAKDGELWEIWREVHAAETQEEWIQSGFAKRGVTVHLPPEPDDALPLLEVLGHPTWGTLFGGPQGTNAPESIPDYFQYNAFRWLRDSGFSPSAFSSSNAVAFTSDAVRAGLIEYTEWYSVFPRHNDVGVLAFGERPDRMYLPAFADPSSWAFWVYLLLWVFPVAAFAAGVALLWRRRKS
ncbi:MAG: hypothetical protein FWG50_13865 [Kiritimatiellaeota bacterium]|nr:hypothetical protein [Kiritimatiellota bacterium]